MTSDKILLTREGYEKMKAELDFLTSTKRLQIAKDLERARAFGDLRENGEYESAKLAQSLNEKRIADLGQRLMRAQIIDHDRIPKDQVFLGAKVTIQDLKTGETIEYMMVAAEEADYRENKIAISSPVGKGLLGHKVGIEVTIRVPAGELKYKILKIDR